MTARNSLSILVPLGSSLRELLILICVASEFGLAELVTIAFATGVLPSQAQQNSRAVRQRPHSPWRRDGDSNPEGVSAVPLFESGSLPFGHPSHSAPILGARFVACKRTQVGIGGKASRSLREAPSARRR